MKSAISRRRIAAVEDSVKPYTSDYEVLVVNDGSQDKTAEIVTRLSQTCPWLRLINNPRNMGMGYSLRAGFEAAVKDYIMCYL